MKPSDFLTELSNEKLAQYKIAASADASKADKEGDFKKGDKRFSGIVKATKKQFDNDSKKLKNESYTVEDEQIDGMAQGEIREIIKNAIHIKNQLDKGVSLDGWMYSYVTTSNDHLNSVAEQINNPNIDEQGVAEKGYGNHPSQRVDPRTGKKYVPPKSPLGQGVAEGLNEFAPDGFNGGDGGEEFNPRLAKMAYDEGFVKGASLADGATTQRAMAINDWDKHDGGIYSQHFAKGFKVGRMDKIRHNNKQYNLNLKLMKDGSIRHGEQGVAEASNTMQRYGQKIIKRAKAARDAEPEPKKEEPQAPSDNSSVSTRDLMQQLRKPKEKGVAEEKCPHCNGPMFSEMIMNEKKDACYYKVKSRYKVWPSAYASGALVKCRNKGASNWGNSSKNESSILEGIEQADESLHDWFNKEKWVRMDTKGNIKGPCAKEPGEGKPKCLPQSKAHSLGKKGRASAAARKRREDPNPDRSGKAINVNTKKKD